MRIVEYAMVSCFQNTLIVVVLAVMITSILFPRARWCKFNGYENIDRNILFTVKEEGRTRGHGVTSAKKQCRLDIRKF